MSPAHVIGRPVRFCWLVMKWPSAIGNDSIHATISSQLKIDPIRVNMMWGRLELSPVALMRLALLGSCSKLPLSSIELTSAWPSFLRGGPSWSALCLTVRRASCRRLPIQPISERTISCPD